MTSRLSWVEQFKFAWEKGITLIFGDITESGLRGEAWVSGGEEGELGVVEWREVHDFGLCTALASRRDGQFSGLERGERR